MIIPQISPVSRAVDNTVQCQSIFSSTPLCTGDIITIIAIGLVVILVIGVAVWSWRMVNQRAAAEEQAREDPHNSVSVKCVMQGPTKPEPVKSAEPDVFWTPQDQLPVLHFHLDPLPSTDEMTEMKRFDFAVRRFSCPFPASPSPRSSWACSKTYLVQSQSFGSTAR
ncbi:hypothetical protein K503DRAFT_76221 [Rhizopogon vinicolor AM-OR11-026]|uniref:Uncharacterized protein n=1 Tax=Rhizopogon vinicolor AM-OR11-026 TaxID=1314800 RepID=A0A1B7MG25_9AGAM|nr:hypothetical protein K503DRAFT_76221 [Rhizopogon vinicolor AM-OR11-026]